MKKVWVAFFTFILFITVWSFTTGSSIKIPNEDKQRTFIGVDKCKMCHKTAKQGEQYRIWSEGSHAKAYNVLASDKAKAIAMEKGIVEDPQKADECLTCHATAWGVNAQYLGKKHKMQDGVGCESCHGAGGDYYKLKTMKAITAGKLDAASVGLVMQEEKVCVRCHNEESPTYKEFDYKTAIKKIAHPIPSK